MSKHKIIGLALCGLILTFCGNGGENTAEESGFSEALQTSQASESVSETTVSETEIPETSETTAQEETESTENFDKVKDRVVFEDRENSLTVGQYINALENCEEFTNRLGFYVGFQIMDMDENGIPEIMLCHYNFMSYTFSMLYKVTKEGKAEAVPIFNHDICDSSDHNECYGLIGGNPVPYEKDGKTVWISRFSGYGTGGGSSGMFILKYDGSGIDGEVIEEAAYEKWGADNENGDWEWYRNDYYYIFGEEVTEEEYDKCRDEYMNSLKPSDKLYVKSSYDEDEFREKLSYALNKYLDMRDGA